MKKFLLVIGLIAFCAAAKAFILGGGGNPTLAEDSLHADNIDNASGTNALLSTKWATVTGFQTQGGTAIDTSSNAMNGPLLTIPFTGPTLPAWSFGNAGSGYMLGNLTVGNQIIAGTINTDSGLISSDGSGDLQALKFIGNGAGLTNLNISGVTNLATIHTNGAPGFLLLQSDGIDIGPTNALPINDLSTNGMNPGPVEGQFLAFHNGVVVASNAPSGGGGGGGISWHTGSMSVAVNTNVCGAGATATISWIHPDGEWTVTLTTTTTSGGTLFTNIYAQSFGVNIQPVMVSGGNNYGGIVVGEQGGYVLCSSNQCAFAANGQYSTTHVFNFVIGPP